MVGHTYLRDTELAMKSIYLGGSLKNLNTAEVSGDYVSLNNEDFYKISNYDQMAPFFMSVVSDSDHWMFISSRGGLSAGRINADNALFPYETDDKVTNGSTYTGSRSLLMVTAGDKTSLWEPFSENYTGVYQTSRNLYKNVAGDKLIFEEVNHDLGVTFQYAWMSSEAYGFVKQSKVTNTGEKVSVEILDGIQNILPYGIYAQVQSEYSCLIDAYKKNELQLDTGLGIFSMSSVLTDKAEPSEALSATTVWSAGLDSAKILLSSTQLDAFRNGESVEQETDVHGRAGAYFVNATFDLDANESKEWTIVAELNQGPAKVSDLLAKLAEKDALIKDLYADVDSGTENLLRIVGTADGLQVTEDTLSSNHHFANVLFNVMRGGIFDDNYSVDKDDFSDFVQHINSQTFNQFADFFSALPETCHYSTLIEQAETQNDAQLMRLCYEYLPLTFSRRHGDPSRPWNRFAIELKEDDGSKILNFQGNWRDIFQNWEALSFSIPNFVESIISKFVNASTIDGYNPYRITKRGIDWEILDPNDPWSNIGYWGDHQVIYLLKLLEFSSNHHPGKLEQFLSQDIFCYANVPYLIKPYQDIVSDPHSTINYDVAREEVIAKRVEQVGADGKLVWDANGQVLQVNLTEKILACALSKLGNFIPEGGIWMNTQRPEWNDANNALVGYGVSMVTLYYLRRFQAYMQALFAEADIDSYAISEELYDFLIAVDDVFKQNHGLLAGAISDADRKVLTDAFGNAASEFRLGVYENGFSGTKCELSKQDLVAFFERSLGYIDHTIRANKREDGLYHAYNLMTATDTGVEVEYLEEMLEGQVAVLSSGVLEPKEAIAVLKSLRASDIYTARQHSYMLYPKRTLKRFTDKNIVPADKAASSKLISQLLSDGNIELVERDQQGQVFFNGRFNNIDSVNGALNQLAKSGYQTLVETERQLIAEIFEQVFQHKSFTGRSGGMYAYEGIGSIYWHMVSKLLLAVQENVLKAIELGVSIDQIDELKALYYDVRAGIGFNKTPDNYGAFPTDPYSHTPGFAGAKQPGMTGQVKEEVITRLVELGVIVVDGKITFAPLLLRKSEFLSAPANLEYFDVSGDKKSVGVDAGQLAFTYCQIPTVYSLATDAGTGIVLVNADGSKTEIKGNAIDAKTSMSIFDKRGDIVEIRVVVQPGME